MQSHLAIDLRSPAVWGLLTIIALGFVGPILWLVGTLDVPWWIWLLAYANWEHRTHLVAGVYHRYFAHASYQIIRWKRFTQFVLGFLAQTSAQGGVIGWAEDHAHHHLYSDTEKDLHSPTRRGFWWAHIGWLLAPRPKIEIRLNRLRQFRELEWLSEWHMICPAINALACFAIGRWAGLLIGFFTSTLVLYNTTWSVNSLVHMFGYRRYDTPDTSRNNWWLSIVLRGEQWHNNHHKFQWRACQGERWWEIDLTHLLFLKPLATIRHIKFNKPLKEAA